MERTFLLLITLQGLIFPLIKAQPGFVNLDCGGTSEYTDDIHLQWKPDSYYLFGERANTSLADGNKQQYYNTVRYFPNDGAKYCYNINVAVHTRYLVRATFLYGYFDNANNSYPKFDLSLGATYWDSIRIDDPETPVVKEMVVLAPSPSLSVCLFNASLGSPFISTIELRPFKGNMYLTNFETQYFMFMVGRTNMGAPRKPTIRYPDDPFDRIWESDAEHRRYWLYDVAPGTENVATNKSIPIGGDEAPPEKVMQTAVVGTEGKLSYTMNLENFPADAWIFGYFAEIEDFGPNETRIFHITKPLVPLANDILINVAENAVGKYKVYEAGSSNVSLDYYCIVEFKKTDDSSRGPILNAFEIFKHVLINTGSLDTTAMNGLVSNNSQAIWAQEGGDPCLPIPWTWVRCNSDGQPRIISVNLSNKNLTGSFPPQLANLSNIVELYLDGNMIEGSIPDFSGLSNIEIIHLENNNLTGPLPSSLANLPKLKELYVQNNNLYGVVPKGLLEKNIIFNYSGNPNLHLGKEGKNILITIFSVIGAALLLLFVAVLCYFCICKRKDNKKGSFGYFPTENSNSLSQIDAKSVQKFELSEIEVATRNFNMLIGKGGFGSVYYGKLSDGIDIAVKVHNIESNQGITEFTNEVVSMFLSAYRSYEKQIMVPYFSFYTNILFYLVALLSRIHHKNLVKFLGYCQQDDNNILVYEFMHEGTLTEHLRGPPEKKIVSWMKRMEIAEDAAKGIEYLHTGCSPAIIHRDLKSSNILLDKNMQAKVSDFGLSKLMADSSHVSSMVKGTVGYLDPEYYATQKFTEKSDIYSFGIILLEMISGYNPISNENFGNDFNYIVAWARELVASGDINAIIDKSLEPTYDVQSVWKIIELALMCVNISRMERPSISEILKEIQEAIMIEQKSLKGRVESIDIFARKPMGHHPKSNIPYPTSESSESTTSFGESFIKPVLR